MRYARGRCEGRSNYHLLQNRLQTMLLVAFLIIYPALLGWLLWGGGLLWWIAGAGIAMSLFMPAATAHWALRLFKARPLSVAQAPGVHAIVRDLAHQAGLASVPTLYYLPTWQLNAFASGRGNQTVLAVSSGLSKLLDRDEMTAVLAHEISHLRHDDMRVLGLAALSGRITGIFSFMGQLLILFNLPAILTASVAVNWVAVLLLVFAPQLSLLTQAGLSRVREYEADRAAAELQGSAQPLASALLKIERYGRPAWQRLFPLGSGAGWLRTHPPTHERVRRLHELDEDRMGGASRVAGEPGFRHRGMLRSFVYRY